MIVQLNNEMTVGDVKAQFSSRYPFLKLEFGKNPHEQGSFVRDNEWYDDDCKISDISKNLQPDYIVIRPWHHTGEVETQFCSQFGLYPQVFRQEGDRWFQTAGTDIFTLTEQNEAGRLMSLKRRGFSRSQAESLF